MGSLFSRWRPVETREEEEEEEEDHSIEMGDTSFEVSVDMPGARIARKMTTPEVEVVESDEEKMQRLKTRWHRKRQCRTEEDLSDLLEFVRSGSSAIDWQWLLTEWCRNLSFMTADGKVNSSVMNSVEEVLEAAPDAAAEATGKKLAQRLRLYRLLTNGESPPLSRVLPWKELCSMTDAGVCVFLAAGQELEALAQTITPSVSRANWWSICNAYPLWQGSMKPMSLVSVLMPSAVKGCRVAPPSRESCVAFYLYRAWAQVHYAGQHGAALETLAIGVRLLMGQQIPSRPQQLSLPTKLRAPPGPMEALLYGLYKLIAQHALQVSVYGQEGPSFEQWMGLSDSQRIARVIEASKPGSTGKELFEQALPCDVPPIPTSNADVISAVYGSSPDALPSGLLEACASTVAVPIDSSVMEYLEARIESTRDPEEAAEVVHRVADVVCASNPTLKPQDRIIRSTARLVQFAVNSVYNSRYAPAVAVHAYVSNIYQSLPTSGAGIPRGVKEEAWTKLMARADRLDAHTTCAELMDSNFNVVCSRVTFRFMEVCSGGTASMTIAEKEYASRLIDGMVMEAGSKPRSELFWQRLLDILLYIVKHALCEAVEISQVYGAFCDQLVGQDSLPEALSWAVGKWRHESGEVDDWVAEAAIRAIDSADALRYDIGIERARRLLKLGETSRARKLSGLLDICALVFDLLSYREYIGGKLVGQAVNVVLKATAPNARASFRDFAFSTPHDIRMLLATHTPDEAAFKLLNAVVAYNSQSLGNSEGLRELSESISYGSWSRAGLLLVCQYSLSDGRLAEAVEYIEQLQAAGYGNCWRLAAAVIQSGGVVESDEFKNMSRMIADGATTCSEDDVFDVIEAVRVTSQYLKSEAGISLPLLSDDAEWAETIPDWPPKNFQDLKVDYTLPGSILGGGIFSQEGCDVSRLRDLCTTVRDMPQSSVLSEYSISRDGPIVDAAIGLLADDIEIAGMLLRLGSRPVEVDDKLLCPVLNNDVISLTDKRRVVAFVKSLSVPGSPRAVRLELIVKLLERCVPLKAEYRYLSVAHLAGDEDYREAVLLRISRQRAAAHREGLGVSGELQRALAVLAQLDGDDEIPDDSDSEFCDDVSTPSGSGDWEGMLDGNEEDLVARLDDPEFIEKVAGNSNSIGSNHRNYNRTVAVLALEQLCTLLTTDIGDTTCDGAAMRLLSKCIELPDLLEDRLKATIAELASRETHRREDEEKLLNRYFLARKLLDIVVCGGGQLTETLVRLHALLPGLNVRRLPLSAESVLEECRGSLSVVAEICVVVDGVIGLGFEATQLADLALRQKSVFEKIPALLRPYLSGQLGEDSAEASLGENDWDFDEVGNDGGWDDEVREKPDEVGGDDESIFADDPDGWDF